MIFFFVKLNHFSHLLVSNAVHLSYFYDCLDVNSPTITTWNESTSVAERGNSKIGGPGVQSNAMQ
ncbi:hypothetical protein PF010_g31932 [Phytophthora fragariae]|uniref:Pectate lyase n=1 Tax=Phytophthora fragariae TaxID=53985 RepID=A0A6G0JG29_9STRA|nr:hypothetical protein PF010_g31932 [Phytophthora fragariae]